MEPNSQSITVCAGKREDTCRQKLRSYCRAATCPIAENAKFFRLLSHRRGASCGGRVAPHGRRRLNGAMSQFAVILPAAGESQRFADKNYKKPFAPLAGRAVWMHSAERFVNRDDVAQVILVIAPADREEFSRRFSANVAILGLDVVDGGQERADSVERALAAVQPAVEFVAVHDAARPCIADAWIDRVFAASKKHGAAVPAVRVASTLKRVGRGDVIAETVDRRNLWESQTPQAFRRDWLFEAYVQRGDFSATDDAQLVERAGHAVHVVTGSPLNRKITGREDLKLAEQILKVLPKPKGTGFAHPFADDELWK